jgi:acetyl esterase
MTSKAQKSELWPGVREEDKMIQMRDGVDIRVRTHSPIGSTATSTHDDASPLMVCFHGGGYCTGSIEAEGDNCREFCKSFGGVAVNVDYRYASRCLEVGKST